MWAATGLSVAATHSPQQTASHLRTKQSQIFLRIRMNLIQSRQSRLYQNRPNRRSSSTSKKHLHSISSTPNSVSFLTAFSLWQHALCGKVGKSIWLPPFFPSQQEPEL